MALLALFGAVVPGPIFGASDADVEGVALVPCVMRQARSRAQWRAASAFLRALRPAITTSLVGSPVAAAFPGCTAHRRRAGPAHKGCFAEQVGIGVLAVQPIGTWPAGGAVIRPC